MPEPIVIAAWNFGRTAVNTAFPLCPRGSQLSTQSSRVLKPSKMIPR